MTPTPNSAKWRAFRVATCKPRTSSVAAMSKSAPSLRRHAAPATRNGRRDGQDAISIETQQVLQPASKQGCKCRIITAFVLDAALDFTQAEHAQKQFAVTKTSQPVHDLGGGLLFAQFRNNDGIEQDHVKSTLRGVSGKRSNVSSFFGTASR